MDEIFNIILSKQYGKPKYFQNQEFAEVQKEYELRLQNFNNADFDFIDIASLELQAAMMKLDKLKSMVLECA